ncbi:MAG: F0F1 ATP synthase subunit B [Oscillospiraceae bacterium]|nr:F0F1 ATP synthase subunit B [Oscillospiraceae bacterium]
MLNLDPWNILFTVINLLIFFLIIKFFLLKPIKKVMDEREQMIKDDFDSAHKTKKEAEELKAEYENDLKTAKDKAMQITAEAKKTAELQKNNIIDSANKQAKQIVDKAQKDASLEYDRTMAVLESEIASLALVAAEKVVKTGSSYDNFLDEEDE